MCDNLLALVAGVLVSGVGFVLGFLGYIRSGDRIALYFLRDSIRTPPEHAGYGSLAVALVQEFLYLFAFCVAELSKF